MHDTLPVHSHACMHSNQAPTVSISKVASDRSIPLVENVPLGSSSLGIQYDTGCQLSLISQSALQALPKAMYSQGTSSRVRVMTFAEEEKIILTTEIKLKLNSYLLKISAMEEDLNNGSGFSFPVPSKPSGGCSQARQPLLTAAKSPSSPRKWNVILRVYLCT